MAKKYKYHGLIAVTVNGVGTVEPDQEFETEIEINHPDFEEIGKQRKEKEDKENK